MVVVVVVVAGGGVHKQKICHTSVTLTCYTYGTATPV